MTIDEASKRYNIPLNILHEYERWGLCNAVKKVMGAWHDIGFESSEIEIYMKLLLEKENSEDERLKILEDKRRNILDDIHLKEKQLNYLDYLRYNIYK